MQAEQVQFQTYMMPPALSDRSATLSQIQYQTVAWRKLTLSAVQLTKWMPLLSHKGESVTTTLFHDLRCSDQQISLLLKWLSVSAR